jgi:signal transduction histidine kinase
MINDLLDLTRIEQGRVALTEQPANPADLVQSAIERFECQADDAGISLDEQIAGFLPDVFVDRERIEHVFDNLIGNALRHTDRGGKVTLTADSDGDMVRFSVTDTGEGIPAQHLALVFDKFFRAPGSKHAGGAGLGLAIVREIVIAHGGQIDVQSRLGSGTTFTFTLPAAGPPHETAAAATARHDSPRV